MSDIFISYASEDRDIAMELVRVFEARGWSAFWDRDILPGRSFDQEIDDALMSARCVVVIWSDVSVRSTWVRGEALRGLERRVLVPVLVRDAVAPIPFNATETIDLGRWPESANPAEVRRLIAGIDHILDSAGADVSVHFRDDPTLSTRVATKVVDAMEGRDLQASSLIRLETLLADTAISLLRRTKGLTRESFLTTLSEVLEAEALLLLLDGRAVFGLGNHVSADDVARSGNPLIFDRRGDTWVIKATSRDSRLVLVCTGRQRLPLSGEDRLVAIADLLTFIGD